MNIQRLLHNAPKTAITLASAAYFLFAFGIPNATASVTYNAENSKMIGEGLWPLYSQAMFIQQRSQEQRVLEDRSEAAQRFRDIFFSLGKDHYTSNELATLLYYPTQTVLNAPNVIEADLSPLAALQKSLEGTLPSDAYNEGLEKGYNSIEPPIAKLKENPPTVIVFPGVFVEFSASRPFEEILQNQESSSAKRWREILKNNARSPLTQDQILQINQGHDVTVSLSEVIDIASIDDTDGAPLVNVVYLRPPRGTLESLGTTEHHTERALRRLSKFFSLWGSSESNIFLTGYSRGGFALLDFLVAARKNPHIAPWARRIRATVGIGATLQGSYFSDIYFSHPKGLGLNIDILVKLARSLETPNANDNIRKRYATTARNLSKWKEALKALQASQTQTADPDPGLVREGIETNSVSTQYAFKMARDSLLKTFVPPTFFDNNEITNIQSFKLAAELVHESFVDISTKNVQEWWKTHTVPTDVTYVSILSTMFNKTTTEEPNPLVFNELAFAPHSIDFAMNRGGYYSLANETGISLNDGAVTAAEATFSIANSMALNSNQRPFKAIPLAILGSHHWSSVMPFGVLSKNQKPSAFPRTLLMLSLASFLQENEM